MSQLADEQIEVESLRTPRGTPIRCAGLASARNRARHSTSTSCTATWCTPICLGRVACSFCRIPALICTAHNPQERSEKGGGTWHKELLYRVTDFLADRTTIICRAAFDRYVKVRAVPSRKLELIPNGIDMQRFSPSAEARGATRESLGVAGRFVWLAVGRLVEQKNYFGLIEALTMLPGDDWVVLIAGNGPLADPLKAECRRRSIANRVKFLGAGENIWELYNAADALVMSSHYEGLSHRSSRSYASMGLPGVVTDVGGNAEVVIDGVTGWVVEPGRPASLAAAMLKLQNAPADARTSFGAAARAHCQQMFRFESVTESVASNSTADICRIAQSAWS